MIRPGAILKSFVAAALIACILMGFIKEPQRGKKFLPVLIVLADSSNNANNIIIPVLENSFKKQKIKTINKSEAGLLIKSEADRVARDYYSNGGTGDWNKLQTYIEMNGYKVANSLQIDLKMDSNGKVNDSIKWSCRSLPILPSERKKTSWNYIIPDSSLLKNGLHHVADFVIEKIIASQKLEKE